MSVFIIPTFARYPHVSKHPAVDGISPWFFTSRNGKAFGLAVFCGGYLLSILLANENAPQFLWDGSTQTGHFHSPKVYMDQSVKKKLSSAQRKRLRGKAHKLKPLVQLGKNGITDALISEVDRALSSHELIKLKFKCHKEAWQSMTDEIEIRSASSCVGNIGNCLIIYREHPDSALRKIRVS